MGDARCSSAEYHMGACDPGNPECGYAPNRVDGCLRRGSEPDWPWERGEYSAGLLDAGGLVRFCDSGHTWGRQGMFVVPSRQDCDDLIELLRVVRERLP